MIERKKDLPLKKEELITISSFCEDSLLSV